MGSQNSKVDSNPNNSFIQNPNLAHNNDSLLLSGTQQSSNSSSFADYRQQSNTVLHTFRWKYGGNDVVVIGSFNQWKERLPMQRLGDEFVLQYPLQRNSVHQYKFIIDGDWRFAHDQPTKKDDKNNINNWIDTSSYPESNNQSPQARVAQGYSQQLCPDLNIMEPDPLPVHLHYVLANHSNSYDYRQKNTIPLNSPIRQTNAELAGENLLLPNELPIPPHVILNHVGIRTNENVIGLTTTQRFREKFVTTIFYKALNK